MPGRNVTKIYSPESYYHVYNRGVAKQPIFIDSKDYKIFISLINRYMNPEADTSKWRHVYPNYADRLELLAYCLMPNHVHFLIYQNDESAMKEFMKSLMTSYGMYFNKRYERVGPVFQNRYRASLINNDSYLDHISRYIHLNPRDWNNYEYSSLKYYRNADPPKWLKPDKVLSLFPSRSQYLEFIKDYEGFKESLDDISWELADS